MYRLAFIIFPILFISSQRVTGQIDSSSSQIFSGKIIDDSLEYALPYVHLWNEGSRMGTTSNDSGEFSIHARPQDTLVFSSVGYKSYVVVVSSSVNQSMEVRLKPKKYEIGEVVVRRFRNYESFKYHVLNHNLPEEKTAQMKSYMNLTITRAAQEADRERAVKDKMETGRVGFITPLGVGINPAKAFKEKISAQKKREQVINAKFNRVLVGDLTHLEGDELTEFIGHCNFSEDYLYETDLHTIIEDMYALLDDYHNATDTIPSLKER